VLFRSPAVWSPPIEVTGLALASGTPTRLAWDSQGPLVGAGVDYDVARGLLTEFPVGAGGSETCVASGLSNPTAEDPEAPGGGQGFWYLVRARDSCGTGTYGYQSNGAERITAACP